MIDLAALQDDDAWGGAWAGHSTNVVINPPYTRARTSRHQTRSVVGVSGIVLPSMMKPASFNSSDHAIQTSYQCLQFVYKYPKGPL